VNEKCAQLPWFMWVTLHKRHGVARRFATGSKTSTEGKAKYQPLTMNKHQVTGRKLVEVVTISGINKVCAL